MKRTLLGWLAFSLSVGCIIVAKDFIGTVVIASFTVTTFHPLYRRLARRMHRRLAAFVITTGIVVVIVAPLVFAVLALSTRLMALVNEIVSRWQNGDLAAALSLTNDEVSLPRFRDVYRDIARAVPSVLASVGKVFFAVSDAVVKAFLFVLLLYGLFLSGEQAIRWLRRASPFDDRVTNELMSVGAETGRGILVGVFLVMLAHGIAATIGYFIIGIGRAFELGALTALAGMVPAIGTGLVWIPLALILVVSGRPGQAIGVTVVGLVVGGVDNLLRPWLSRLGRVPLPTLPLFIAFFGGLTAFGPSGLVLGPLLFAWTKAALDLRVSARLQP